MSSSENLYTADKTFADPRYHFASLIPSPPSEMYAGSPPVKSKPRFKRPAGKKPRRKNTYDRTENLVIYAQYIITQRCTLHIALTAYIICFRLHATRNLTADKKCTPLPPPSAIFSFTPRSHFHATTKLPLTHSLSLFEYSKNC